MSTISSSTTSTTAYKVTADTTGTLVLQTGATPTTAVTVGTDQSVTFAQGANLPNTFGFKNRIINGAMVIDQRNNGSAVTSPSGGFVYGMDRWAIFRFNDTTGTFTLARSTTVPAGYINSALITVTAAQASVPGNAVYRFAQNIEGFNTADFGWGTANAQTATMSFWVRSSVTGTFGGRLRNSASNRSYVFQYTVNSANTFEYKTITIPGDTSGTWLTDNGIGISIEFNIGDGSNFQGTANAWQAGEYTSASGNVKLINTLNATLYITGFQFEKGSTATSFDFRSYGTELALCQRYCQMITSSEGSGNYMRYAYGECTSTTGFATNAGLFAKMRVTPSLTVPNVAFFGVFSRSAVTTATGVSIGSDGSSPSVANISVTVASGLTLGSSGCLISNNTQSSYCLFTAEL